MPIVLAADVSPKGKFLVAAALSDGVFACNDLLNLVPALVTLKDADFQILERMRRPSSQMRIAAALFTTKRRNKFVILPDKGMLLHTSPDPSHSENAAPSSAPLCTPPSRSPDQVIIIRVEDGKLKDECFFGPFLRPLNWGDGALEG
jgi:hypothetical protein